MRQRRSAQLLQGGLEVEILRRLRDGIEVLAQPLAQQRLVGLQLGADLAVAGGQQLGDAPAGRLQPVRIGGQGLRRRIGRTGRQAGLEGPDDRLEFSLEAFEQSRQRWR